MIVRLRLDFPDVCRRAIRAHSGEPGLATRDNIRTGVEQVIDATLDDLVYELERDEPRARRKYEPED